MIKFFRRIRQQLLSQNRFSKYLLYAMGEIVLVVIGILIALSINNWNQTKQDERNACIYLSNLIIDLQYQLLNIENQFDFEQEVVQNSEELLSSYRSNNAFIVDDAFSQQLSILNNRLTFKIANSTFEELLSSGNTKLFENESLKTSLLAYFKDIERDKQVITQNNLYVDNHFAPMALEISTHYMPNLHIDGFKEIINQGFLDRGNNVPLMNKRKAYDIINRKLKSSEYELKLLNEITYRYRTSAVHLSITHELKSKTENLLRTIKLELKECSSYD